MQMKGTIARRTAGAAIACLALAACGGSSSSASSSTGSRPGGASPISAQEQAKIRDCLEAAGIDLPTFPSGGPSGFPSGPLSGAPSFDPNQPPPSGFPGGGGGGFNDPKIQQALSACGISLPTPAPSTG